MRGDTYDCDGVLFGVGLLVQADDRRDQLLQVFQDLRRPDDDTQLADTLGRVCPRLGLLAVHPLEDHVVDGLGLVRVRRLGRHIQHVVLTPRGRTVTSGPRICMGKENRGTGSNHTVFYGFFRSFCLAFSDGLAKGTDGPSPGTPQRVHLHVL